MTLTVDVIWPWDIVAHVEPVTVARTGLGVVPG